MGYACPVCDTPQADGEHLANHVAFTAMLQGDDHAQFLDDHIEDWEDRKPPELAAELIHYADQTTYDTVFEDTTAGSGTGHSSDDSAGMGAQPPAGTDDVDLDELADDTLDEETRRVIDEARKLFEQGDDAEED